MYYIYVIKSKSTNKIYIGQTSNLKSRLGRHNSSLNRKTSYTFKNKGPWVLVYKEEYLKSHIGRDFIKKMLGP